MTFFHFGKMDGWQGNLAQALVEEGWAAARKGGGLSVWSPKRLKPCRGLSYVDGFVIAREPLGGGSPVLSLSSRRHYFDTGSTLPASKPERILFSGNPPAHPHPEVRITSCLQFAKELAAVLPGFDGTPLKPSSVRTNVHMRTKLVLGGSIESDQIHAPWMVLPATGFHSVPDSFTVNVSAANANDPRARVYAEELLSAFGRYRCDAEINLMSYGDLVERGLLPGEVGLIALEGRKPAALRSEENEFLDLLDARGMPYRMFSLSNTNQKWSACDQAASLVYTAGGIPYKLSLPWPDGLGDTFVVGVDLGHPYGSDHSILVISLLDSAGIHLHSWRFRQKRDETADLDALEAGLGKVAAMAAAQSGMEKNRFLVIRDGRRNLAERVSHYRGALSPELSFVDLSKRSTGHMFAGTINGPTPAQPGSVCVYGDYATPFLTSIAPPTPRQMVNAQKIIMRESWDGLNLGSEVVTDLIAGLCYAPSLGMKPHRSPAPVYWANGIASIKETNCQFRGQRYSESHVCAGRNSILAI
jgi:hypothetical protein